MKTNLQAMRKKAGFKSAREFAESVGLNVGTYTNYEQGQRDLSLATAWKLADALHCSLDELAGRDFKAPERPRPALTGEERELLGIFRSAGPMRRRDLLGVARALGPGDGGRLEERA